MAVKFEQKIDIDAPPERVWAVFADPTSWSDWLPDADEVSQLTEVAPGATFQWRSGDGAGQGAIQELDAQANRLTFVTQGDGGPVTHTFDVDRSGGMFGMGGQDTRLRYIMEYDPPGGMIGDFVVGGNPMDAMKVKRTLERIRDLTLLRGQA
jgi:carbon monoxide dehydrogenase subunit G